MKNFILHKPIVSSILIFLACLALRMLEYFVLRTDETFFSENFLHKLTGLFILIFLLKTVGYKFHDIGFIKKSWFKYLSYGLLLGLACFAIAYLVEYLVLSLNSQNPSLSLYINGFSLSGEGIRQTGLVFFVLCIIFNIVNVLMEEGIFRGFLLKIISNRNSFLKANLIVALLFGLWHFVMPFRSFVAGEIDFIALLIMTLGYILLSGAMSLKWGILYRMSGSLWISIGDHLFNNAIATNLLHVVTVTGADELQIVRIIIAQAISFAIVYALYQKAKRSRRISMP